MSFIFRTAVCITFLTTVLLTSSVQADVIDFESLMQENSGINVVGSSYEEDGFVITGVDLGNLGTLDGNFSGSTSLTSDSNSILALSRVNGGPFALQSIDLSEFCLLYTSPSPRDQRGSRMPSSA